MMRVKSDEMVIRGWVLTSLIMVSKTKKPRHNRIEW